MHLPNRLRARDDFQRLRREGRSVGHKFLVAQAAENGSDVTRFGFSVSRRVGNAVVRNLVRRQLREITRRVLPELPAGWDVLLIARPPAAGAGYDELAHATRSLLRRSGLLR